MQGNSLAQPAPSSYTAQAQAGIDNVSKAPKPLSRAPYLIEKNTGAVLPWTKELAARSDLVDVCYNLDGSFNPEDADPNYDPDGARRRKETQDALRRKRRIERPQTASERAASIAEAKSEVRKEAEDQILMLTKEIEKLKAEAAELKFPSTSKPTKKTTKSRAGKVTPTPEIPEEVAMDLDAVMDDIIRNE